MEKSRSVVPFLAIWPCENCVSLGYISLLTGQACNNQKKFIREETG